MLSTVLASGLERTLCWVGTKPSNCGPIREGTTGRQQEDVTVLNDTTCTLERVLG